MILRWLNETLQWGTRHWAHQPIIGIQPTRVFSARRDQPSGNPAFQWHCHLLVLHSRSNSLMRGQSISMRVLYLYLWAILMTLGTRQGDCVRSKPEIQRISLSGASRNSLSHEQRCNEWAIGSCGIGVKKERPECDGGNRQVAATDCLSRCGACTWQVMEAALHHKSRDASSNDPLSDVQSPMPCGNHPSLFSKSGYVSTSLLTS